MNYTFSVKNPVPLPEQQEAFDILKQIIAIIDECWNEWMKRPWSKTLSELNSARQYLGKIQWCFGKDKNIRDIFIYMKIYPFTNYIEAISYPITVKDQKQKSFEQKLKMKKLLSDFLESIKLYLSPPGDK